jgi:Fic family protein
MRWKWQQSDGPNFTGDEPRLRKAEEQFLLGSGVFAGSAENYVTMTGASPATATRDLADLVDKQALQRHGERRHARYELAIGLRRVSGVKIDNHGNVIIPA